MPPIIATIPQAQPLRQHSWDHSTATMSACPDHMQTGQDHAWPQRQCSQTTHWTTSKLVRMMYGTKTAYWQLFHSYNIYWSRPLQSSWNDAWTLRQHVQPPEQHSEDHLAHPNDMQTHWFLKYGRYTYYHFYWIILTLCREERVPFFMNVSWGPLPIILSLFNIYHLKVDKRH